MRILIIEDDKKQCYLLQFQLEKERYDVDVCFDGDDAQYYINQNSYDIILLDRMLPHKDGIEILKQMRNNNISVPVIMLTALGELNDKITGLDSGADDYLAKPFSFEVLLARIRALLRRPSETQDVVLTVADLQIDPASRTVLRDGHDISLSSKEFSLLEYLARNRGRVISKDQLIAHVWDFDADILPNTVEVFIKFIRDKVEKPFPKSPKLIHTVRGLGYKVEVK